jgi:hypothetical protein
MPHDLPTDVADRVLPDHAHIRIDRVLKAVLVAFEGLASGRSCNCSPPAAAAVAGSALCLASVAAVGIARSGHVDIVAIAFLLLAFVAIERRSPILAGAAPLPACWSSTFRS